MSCKWIPTTTRPKSSDRIIILTDSGDVVRGYMRKFYFEGHVEPTFSYHGRYYDFEKHQVSYCLVNAIGWMPMPELPEETQ